MIDRLLTFRFGEPWWLLLLLLVPLFAWLHGRRAMTAGLRYSSVAILRQIGVRPRSAAGEWLWKLGMISLAAFVLALARPRIEQGKSADPREGIDIVLTIDLSASMEEKDFVLNGESIPRSKALRLALEEFVQNRPNDRFGIVGFATDTYMVTPMTTDGSWIKDMLEFVKADMFGTAIGEGIVSAVDLLREAKGKSKVIVVATDGENNTGRDPLEAAEIARSKGIRIHVLRIAPLRSVSADNAVKSLMAKVAEKTGGLYFQAADLNSVIDVYRQIDRMEKSRLDQIHYRLFDELYAWFLIPGALGMVITWIGSNTKWARLP